MISSIGPILMLIAGILTALAIVYAMICNSEFETYKTEVDKIVRSISSKYYKLKEDYDKLANSK